MKQNKLKTTLLLAVICMVSYQISAQEGEVTIDQNKDITTLLEYKKDIKTVNLYKIQLDFGSRSEAEALKEKFQNNFAQWPAQMVYETPNYKVWVGNFSTRLEADIALLQIKKKFSKAMVFQPKKDN